MTIGMIWSQESHGVWSRHLARRYMRAKQAELLFEALTQVLPGNAFCMVCLSQNIHPTEDDSQWLFCADCNVYFYISDAKPPGDAV